MEPLILPLFQRPTKSYGIATTQRQRTSKRSGNAGGGGGGGRTLILGTRYHRSSLALSLPWSAQLSSTSSSFQSSRSQWMEYRGAALGSEARARASRRPARVDRCPALLCALMVPTHLRTEGVPIAGVRLCAGAQRHTDKSTHARGVDRHADRRARSHDDGRTGRQALRGLFLDRPPLTGLVGAGGYGGVRRTPKKCKCLEV